MPVTLTSRGLVLCANICTAGALGQTQHYERSAFRKSGHKVIKELMKQAFFCPQSIGKDLAPSRVTCCGSQGLTPGRRKQQRVSKRWLCQLFCSPAVTRNSKTFPNCVQAVQSLCISGISCLGTVREFRALIPLRGSITFCCHLLKTGRSSFHWKSGEISPIQKDGKTLEMPVLWGLPQCLCQPNPGRDTPSRLCIPSHRSAPRQRKGRHGG